MYRLLPLLLLPSLAAAAPAPRPEPGRHLRPRIEVAFVLDATGSMGPWIKEARNRIKDIAGELAAGEPAPSLRYALVSYRDKGDAYVTKAHPFSAKVDDMRRALDSTRAQGGGDTPEAVLEAMKMAIHELDWSEDQGTLKLLYLVGDAQPQRYPDSPDEEHLLLAALQKGIVINTIACGHMAQSGQSFFERVARLSEGRPFRLKRSRGRAQASVSKAGAKGARSLASAVSGSAKAYSGSLGVDFAKATPIAIERRFDAEGETGLIGAQLRRVTEQATWSDLWAAHQSPTGKREAPPSVDFEGFEVLVLGGAGGGLQLISLERAGEARVATVKAAPPGLRFAIVPASDTPIVTKGGV